MNQAATGKALFEGDQTKFRGWSNSIYGEMILTNCHEHVLSDVAGPTALDLTNYPGATLERGPDKDGLVSRWSALVTHWKASHKEWLDRKHKCYGIIFAGLSDVLKEGVNGNSKLAFSPFETWDFLQKTYGVRNIDGVRLEVQKALFKKLSMQDSGDVITFLISFKLAALDAQVTDETELITQICKVGTLPLRFDVTCMAISLVKGIQWEECQRQLRICDTRYQASRQLVEAESSVRSVRAGKDQPRKGRADYGEPIQQKGKASNGITPCFQCGNIHKFWDCLSRHCPTCDKMNAHVPLECPKLSWQHKKEMDEWKSSRGTGTKSTPPAQNFSFRQRRVAAVGEADGVGDDSVLSDSWGVVTEDADDYGASLEDHAGFGFSVGRPEKDIRMVKSNRGEKRKFASDLFFLDSGAAVHCTPSAHLLSNVEVMSKNLLAANESVITVTHKGMINEYIYDVHVTPEMEVSLLSEDALRKAGLWVMNPSVLPTSGSFVSSYICDRKGNVIFTADQDRMVDVSKVLQGLTVDIPKAPRVLKTSTLRSRYALDNKGLSDFVHAMHVSLGHPCESTMIYMADHKVINDFPLTSSQIRKHWVECVACWKGKMVRSVPKMKTTRKEIAAPLLYENDLTLDTLIGGKICSDIYGPLPEGTGGRKYAITFTDSSSGLVMIATAVSKSYLLEAIRHLIAEYAAAGHHSALFKKPIGILQSDAEQVYRSEDVAVLLREHGIKLQFSAPYAHEQNGTAERMHRWIGESLATLYSDAPWVPIALWNFAIMFIGTCLNLHPRVGKDFKMTPFEQFYGKKPSMRDWVFLPWGSPVLFAIPPTQRAWKGSAHCHEGAYLGPAMECKRAIRVYNFSSKRVCISYSWHQLQMAPAHWPRFEQVGTTFLEDEEELEQDSDKLSPHMPPLLFDELISPVAILPSTILGDKNPSNREDISLSEPDSSGSEILRSDGDDTSLANTGISKPSSSNPSSIPAEPRASRARTGLLGHLATVDFDRLKQLAVVQREIVAKVRNNIESPSVAQALRSPERKSWEAAMKLEMDQLEMMQAFVDPSENYDAFIRSMFVLKRKMDAEGNWVKFKARLVAIGSRQPIGTFDYCGSSTARSISVKLFLAYLTSRGLPVDGYDVPSAYLHAKTEDATTTDGDPNIHIQLPNGSIRKLARFLYGTKQAGAEWFNRYSSFLLKLGYDSSITEPCLWIRRENREAIWGEPLGTDEKFHMLCVFVDDNLAGGNCSAYRNEFEAQFEQDFGKCERKSGTFTFLGMLIESTNDFCKISMPSYIEKLIKTSGIDTRKLSKTAGYTRFDLDNATAPTDGEAPADKEEYMRLVGTINFLALHLRFDLLNQVSRLSQYMQSPTVHHFNQVKKLVKFVNATTERCLIYRKGGGVKLHCFVDASFNSNEGSYSQSGEVIFLGNCSGAIHCKSSKQTVIAASAAEAELIALYELLRTLVWLREVMEDMGMCNFGSDFEDNCPVIFEDNSATFNFMDSGGCHQNTKHFRRRIHAVAEFIKEKIAVVVKVESKNNCADACTKQNDAETSTFHGDMIFDGPFGSQV